MRSLRKWLASSVAVVALSSLVTASSAVAAEFSGGIDGFEIAIQNRSHGAVFVFGFEGTVDGRTRSGWGWIEVVHDDLVDEPAGVTGVLYGRGALWIGLRRYDIDVLPGQLIADGTGLFAIDLPLDITPRRGQTTSHAFSGLLSHQTFPPTIGGTVWP